MLKKEEKEYEEYESLKNSKFKQQKLPGWRPVPSMIRTTIIFISLGIVFAGLGVFILLFSNETVEFSKRYDNECPINGTCNINITIGKDMNKNILIYYQLDNFYQNHRKYIEGKSDKQLKGENISLQDMKNSKDCDPFITNGDMGLTGKFSFNNKTKLEPNNLAIPCGIMAKNYFNDNFTNWKLKRENNETLIDLYINENNIARKSDIKKYKNINENLQWLDMTDEHFIVWMRPSPFSNFTKLWGRIECDLKKGDIIYLDIKNNYDAEIFKGAKYLVLKTVNNFGGNNTLLAIAYMFFGGICLILGIIFIIGFKAHTKKEK